MMSVQPTAADLALMQGLAQDIWGSRPELVNSGASYGELAWIWGKGQAAEGASWRRRLWFVDGVLVAWGWAELPRRVPRNDGSVKEVTAAFLNYQVHPAHAELVDEVIDWYESVTPGLERSLMPAAADEFGLARWKARGYAADDYSTQLNERDLDDLERPALPDGYHFRTAAEAGPDAAVRAHADAWAPSTYTAASYAGVRRAAAYRPDLHVLVEAPDGTMAASTIMWLDPVHAMAEFEPVGTHPEHRRRGLARAMLLHGMRLARDAGAVHMTVVNSKPDARDLYHSVGFRYFSRDAPLVKKA